MGFFSNIPGMMGDAQGMAPVEGDNFAPGSNYRQAPGQRPGVQIGSPGGMMPPQNLTGIAEQSQQMANNPIYGQGSPFQPPTPSSVFQPTYQQQGFNSLEAMKDAMDPNWRNSPAQRSFGPAPQPSLPMMDSVGGMAGGKMGMIMDAANKQSQPQPNPAQNPLQGQLVGGPVDKPIFGNQPNVGFGRPGELVGGPVDKPIIGGGLRPAPRNYRPPVRRPNLRSFGRR